MTMKALTIGLVALFAVVAAGCGAAREAQQAAESAPTANVAGSWSGAGGTGGLSVPITMNLTQNGTNVSGTMSVAGRPDFSGAVKGTVQGELLYLSLATATLGQLTVKQDTMSGQLIGGLGPVTLRRAR
jgi:hypothetical protein